MFFPLPPSSILFFFFFFSSVTLPGNQIPWISVMKEVSPQQGPAATMRVIVCWVSQRGGLLGGPGWSCRRPGGGGEWSNATPDPFSPVYASCSLLSFYWLFSSFFSPVVPPLFSSFFLHPLFSFLFLLLYSLFFSLFVLLVFLLDFLFCLFIIFFFLLPFPSIPVLSIWTKVCHSKRWRISFLWGRCHYTKSFRNILFGDLANSNNDINSRLSSLLSLQFSFAITLQNILWSEIKKCRFDPILCFDCKGGRWFVLFSFFPKLSEWDQETLMNRKVITSRRHLRQGRRGSGGGDDAGGWGRLRLLSRPVT